MWQCLYRFEELVLYLSNRLRAKNLTFDKTAKYYYLCYTLSQHMKRNIRNLCPPSPNITNANAILNIYD